MTLAPSAREVAGGKTHAPACPMHQHGLAGLQAADFHQRDIGSVIGRAHCRRSGEIHSFRHMAQRGRGERDIFGERAGLGPSAHPVAYGKAAAGRRFHDLAGHFQSRDEGRFGFELVFPARHQQVGIVERGRAHADHNLASGPFHLGQCDAGQVGRKRGDEDGLHCGQKLSLAARRAAKVSAGLVPPQRSRSASASARRKGLVASSRDSTVGTVGSPLARCSSMRAA